MITKYKLKHLTLVKEPYKEYNQKPKISSSRSVYDILKQAWKLDIDYRERFLALYLNRANRIIGISEISVGGVSATVVDSKIVFGTALRCGASSVIVAHNHPSGNTIPSNPDISITNKLKRAGEILDISLLDHLIITSEKYFSFADEGKL